MSVEDKLNRLVIARDNIRAALEEQGIDASDHGFEGFAEDIGDIEKGESLPDIDLIDFGDDPTLPAEGKTNPANYEAIADAINAAKARSNAVTLESLTVTQNGTQIAPAGAAWNEVEVDVVAKLQNKTVTQNGAVTPDAGYDGLSEVVVNVPTGGGETEAKDVNFYDYDGTITNSYTAQEFSALTEMPENPSHTGLTAQGWNWSLSDAKTHVAAYGMLDIGQMYITDDGKTRVYFELDSVHLTPYLGFGLNGTAVIDWGDGSAEETVTGSNIYTLIQTPHTYTIVGEYMISIAVTGEMRFLYASNMNGGCVLLGSAVETSAAANYYRKRIKKVEIGSGILSISSSSFSNCSALQSVTIPSTVTALDAAFGSCSSLRHVTIPSGINILYSLSSLYSLKSVSIPNSITNINLASFSSNPDLQRVSLPGNVTQIPNTMFQQDYTLQRVSLPSGLTSIPQAMCNMCSMLKNIIIPSSVTSIRDYAFTNCYALQSITIPNGVTSIGVSAFSSCYGLISLRFEPTTPPTVTNSNAFSGLPTDCVIYVPTGTLNDYKTATNYPDPNTYTYVEYS